MKISQSMSMHKTTTMPISLPKISKLNVKQSRYNPINQGSFRIGTSRGSLYADKCRQNNSRSFVDQKSGFTVRVEKEVLDQDQYPYTETNNIEKQQNRLKELLKEFNEETVSILQKYVIDRPVKKQFVKRTVPIQEMHYVREKESENAMNLITILKNEIEKLESRCQNLKYTSKEEFQYRIKELKEQKQKRIAENKEISREITLNGLQIVKGKESLVKELQYEQFLVDSKRDKLKIQSQRVNTDTSSLQKKIKEINAQIDKLQQQNSFSLKLFEDSQKQKIQSQLYEEYSKKKKIFEHFKIINQSNNYQLKHQYFQKLKELNQTNIKEENIIQKTKQHEGQIQKKQEIIKELQKKQGEILQKIQPKSFVTQPFNTMTQTVFAKINIKLG